MLNGSRGRDGGLQLNHIHWSRTLIEQCSVSYKTIITNITFGSNIQNNFGIQNSLKGNHKNSIAFWQGNRLSWTAQSLFVCFIFFWRLPWKNILKLHLVWLEAPTLWPIPAFDRGMPWEALWPGALFTVRGWNWNGFGCQVKRTKVYSSGEKC